MKKRIFFDQDGTLVESGPGIKHCARKTLEKRKLPVVPYEELDFFVGPPLRDCFRLCRVPEERIEEACQLYRHFYGDEGGKYDANVYPGIVELLDKLKKEGNLLFIATSKAGVLAKDIVEHFGFDKYFDGFFGASLDGSHALKKDILHQGLVSTDPALPAVRIGDTYLDIVGANENKIPSFGVVWGYGDKQKRMECGAKKVCASCAELYDSLEKRTASDFENDGQGN